jgi:hypothetical protein
LTGVDGRYLKLQYSPQDVSLHAMHGEWVSWSLELRNIKRPMPAKSTMATNTLKPHSSIVSAKSLMGILLFAGNGSLHLVYRSILTKL